MPHRIIWSWFTGRSPPRPLLAVPKFTSSDDTINPLWAHQSRTATNHYTAIRWLVHWPLMGGLYQNVTAHPHQRPVYQSSYCCIMSRCCAVLMLPWRVNCIVRTSKLRILEHVEHCSSNNWREPAIVLFFLHFVWRSFYFSSKITIWANYQQCC